SRSGYEQLPERQSLPTGTGPPSSASSLFLQRAMVRIIRTFVVELCEQQRVLEKIPVFRLAVLQKGADQLLIAATRAHHVVSWGELDFPASLTCSVIAGHPVGGGPISRLASTRGVAKRSRRPRPSPAAS